jgi:two-component system, chemotaxis family, protein-glutamate methylesterase/glutaminase
MVDVVAIGASLGGLFAFQRILAQLPADLPAAVALVQHRLPDVDSGLVDLLAQCSAMPVVEPDHGEPIRAGHVYLAPVSYHLMVEDNRFALSTEGPVRFARPSIDVLFSTLAEARGPRAIAVVLTGASDDGAEGAVHVKRQGGRVVVQEPSGAESAVMPRAALARINADAIVPLEAVAACITALVRAQPWPAQALAR